MKTPRMPQAPPVTAGWSEGQCLLALVVVAALAYSAALTNTFAHSDDYSFLWQNLTRGELWRLYLSFGRGVGWLILSGALLPVDSIQGLWFPRLVSIAGILAVALGSFVSLRRLGYSQFLSLVAALVLLLLPSFTVYAVWAVSCHSVYGAVLALPAFWLVERASQDTAWRSRLRWGLGGMLLLVAALNTYQPTAMFYFTLLMALVLSPDLQGSSAVVLRRIGSHLLVAAVALGLSFVLLRLTAPYFGEQAQRGALGVDLQAKLSWFFQEPLSQSFLVLFLPLELPLSLQGQEVLASVLLLGVIPLGLFLFLPSARPDRLWRVVGALLLLPLTYLPNLIVAESWASYRTRGALAAAVALLLLVALSGLVQRLRLGELPRRYGSVALLLGLVVLGVSLNQFHITHYFVVPFEVEWRVVRQELAQASASAKRPPQELVFLMPPQERPLPRLSFYDEFGHLSTARQWVPEAMCHLVLRELSPKEEAALRTVRFTLVPPGKPAPAPREDCWVIDARKITFLSDSFYGETK